jgi:hypothetical protein
MKINRTGSARGRRIAVSLFVSAGVAAVLAVGGAVSSTMAMMCSQPVPHGPYVCTAP